MPQKKPFCKDNPIEKELRLFQELFDKEDYEQAIVVIKRIIDINPDISTSWFNYGACLDSLKKYNQAAEAYLKASALEKNETVATKSMYRCFYSYFSAKNAKKFYSLMEKKLKQDPWLIDIFLGSAEFDSFYNRPEFRKLIAKYKKN